MGPSRETEIHHPPGLTRQMCLPHGTMETRAGPDREGILEGIHTHLQCTTMEIVAGSYVQIEGERGPDIGTSADKSPINTTNNVEDGMVFHMDGRGAKDDDRDKLLWQG